VHPRGSDPRRIGLFNLDTMTLVTEWAYVSNAQDGVYTATWEQGIDPEALRVHGTVEFLVPNGNTPRVYRKSQKRPRVRLAA